MSQRHKMGFEYKIVKFEDLNQPKSHDLDIYENEKKISTDEELTKKLNLLGKDGWELIFVLNGKFFLKKII